MQFKRIKNFLLLLITTILAFSFTNFTSVKAISSQAGSDPSGKSQRYVIENAPWYDPTACPGGNSVTTNPSLQGKVYLVGDSITANTQYVQTDLINKLKSKGFSDVVINSLSSRSLTSGSSPLNGITVFENDPAWNDANTIIIELGTNGGVNKENITSIINAIKEKNSSANIFWVNVGANNNQRPSNPIDTEAINKLLTDNSSLGYKVIDWKSVVDQHPEYISDLGVHPFTKDGGNAYVATIINGLSSLTPNTNAIGGSCECNISNNGGSSNLAGKDNKEKVWNFLIGKGLTPNQVAGIMGNMEAEAHFEPRLVEYNWKNSRGEISKAGQPSSLDDVIPPTQGPHGEPGYGIVQWTSVGRKQGLSDKATQTGRNVSDLALQLDFLWYELTEGGYKSVYEDIKKSESVDQVSEIFLRRFEVPGNIPGQIPIRLGFAQKILNEFGGTTITPSSNCSSGSDQTALGAKIVTIALQQLAEGANEADGTYKKYTNGITSPWCAYFVSWVLNEAGAPFTGGWPEKWQLPAVSGVQAYFEKVGTFHKAGDGYVPKPGDVAIYNNGPGYNPEGHVRFVISTDTTKGVYNGIGGNEADKIGQADYSYLNDRALTGFGTPLAK